ncbi:MAG: hypothetical protein ACFFG0_09670 [Candidatus Thorarchaeota archaeon]
MTKSETRLPSIKRFPNQQIASITEPFKDPETGLYDVRLISKGFSKEQIEKEFPADPLVVAKAIKRGIKPPTFNMRMLIRSIIVEDFEKIGTNRERGNIRHLFYTNIIYALTRIMEITNIDSLNTTINNAWKDVIESGIVTYEGMNIESGKRKFLQSFARHSPFSNFIICVEKESLLESLSWTAKLFRTTIITAGGQPSREAIRAFIRSLNYWKCDLNKPFYLLVITDLDPAGWYIQEAFQSQIQKALKYYNNNKGEVKKPIRLFLRLNQITDKLINEMAVPAKDPQAKSSQSIKSSRTKIKRFQKKIGEDWKRLFINNEMMKVELDVIDATQMEKEIANQLLSLIDDHSLILIPEIMDELEKLRKEVIQELYKSYKESEIDSIIEEYLTPIQEKKKEIRLEHEKEKDQVREEYNEIDWLIDTLRFQIRDEIKDIIQPKIDKYTKYTESLVIDEREEIKEKENDIENLQEQIDEIQEEIDTLEEEIEEKIGFYTTEIDEIEENLSESQNKLSPKKSLLLDSPKKIRDQEFERIEKEFQIFNEKIDTFESQKEGKFGSYLRSVEKQFQDSFNSEQVPIFFHDVESDSKIKIQLAYLLTHPKLLLHENKSILNHPKPAFKESYLLHNALNSVNFQDTKKNPDLSKFRNTFSKPLINSLKGLIKRKLDPIPIKLDSVVDLPEEYNNELNDLIQEIKNEIAQTKLYSFLNYHPEDMKSQNEEEKQ